jgi:hypothetical protein
VVVRHAGDQIYDHKIRFAEGEGVCPVADTHLTNHTARIIIYEYYKHVRDKTAKSEGGKVARNALKVRHDLMGHSRNGGETFSTGHKGAIIGSLNDAFGSDWNRRIALSWLFKTVPDENFSTKYMTDGEWYALNRWIGSWHEEDGWHVSRSFYVEANAVVRFALKEYAASTFGVGPNGVVANGASLDGYKTIRELHDKE